MKKTLRLSSFQIGTPRKRGQGLRIGTVRRPPRGVPRSRWVRDGYFDVWLPAVAPSRKLLHRFTNRDWDDPTVRKAFFDSYERELMSNADRRQMLEFIATLAKQTNLSIGCFCGDEARCHRSRLLKVIKSFT